MAETDDVGGSGEVVLLRLGLLALPDQSAPTTGSLTTGATVTVTRDGVRLRSGPSTSSPVITGLAAGPTLTVPGTPVEADGIEWVPVVDPANSDRKGFVSAEFLEVTPAR